MLIFNKYYNSHFLVPLFWFEKCCFPNANDKFMHSSPSVIFYIWLKKKSVEVTDQAYSVILYVINICIRWVKNITMIYFFFFFCKHYYDLFIKLKINTKRKKKKRKDLLFFLRKRMIKIANNLRDLSLLSLIYSTTHIAKIKK